MSVFNSINLLLAENWLLPLNDGRQWRATSITAFVCIQERFLVETLFLVGFTFINTSYSVGRISIFLAGRKCFISWHILRSLPRTNVAEHALFPSFTGASKSCQF